MRPSGMTIPKPMFQAGIQTLLAVVLFCATVCGGLRWQFDSYQHDWEVEQRALGEMRRTGATFTTMTQPIGPPWLRRLTGAKRSKYFDRVFGLFFTASDSNIVDNYRKSFKHLGAIMQD